MFRAHCPRCQRPLTHCLCALIPQLPSQTRVVVLQHPQEAKHALNTARLATLGLINSEMRCAERFTDLRELLANPEFKSCLLFPGDQSIPVGDFAINSAQRPLQLIVPDGTWRKVRKMLYLNPDRVYETYQEMFEKEKNMPEDQRIDFVSKVWLSTRRLSLTFWISW